MYSCYLVSSHLQDFSCRTFVFFIAYNNVAECFYNAESYCCYNKNMYADVVKNLATIKYHLSKVISNASEYFKYNANREFDENQIDSYMEKSRCCNV